MKRKVLLIIVFIVLIVTAGVLTYLYYNRFIKEDNVDENQEVVQEETIVEEVKEEKKLQIYTGTDRPIAVMIDNERPAWPHSGLQDAYMIYEMIIEGGESRMMALFKNKTTAKIGPIRSVRHYFLHYAMEHGAIFVHFGWSPKAKSTISTYKINNINGIYDTFYWRVGTGYHNAFSSIEKILNMAKTKKYVTTGTDKPIYNYSVDELDLENGVKISGLQIKYSELHNVSYKYDEEKKVFYRSMRGIAHKDRETGEQYYAKNIVIMYVKNYNLPDSETKGRQELENLGTGKGYYITNGKCIEITWKKESATSRTLWLDSNNNEIVLNDGLTFVQLAPSKYIVELEVVENIDVENVQ